MHTPGPWRIYGPAQEHRFPGVDAQNKTIVVFGETDDDYLGVRGDTTDEARANARLIASAPCMASELLSALDYFESREDIDSEHEEDGSPRPNEEMRMANSIREVLKRAGIDPKTGDALR